MRRVHEDLMNGLSYEAQCINNKYNKQINPLHFEWDKFIFTLERHFPDVLNEMLSCNHQWHLSDQNESRSTISRNGEPNYNARERLNNRAQKLQPPDPRNTQPHTRGIFYHSKNSSHTTPETTFNCHHNSQFRNQTYHTTKTADKFITLWHLKQQAHYIITNISMVGDHFSQTTCLIAIFLVTIIITIYITLT